MEQKKTYPELMAGRKLMYVHGFMSAGSTHTAQLLREFMPESTVISPDLPLHPEEAMQLLRDIIAAEKPDLIVGTSMGGMYTEMLRGVDRICINPAFQMGETMREHGMIGKQTFQNPRADGVQEFIVTKALQKEYTAICEQCFQDITDEDRGRVYGLFGDEDPVVHTFDMFHEHYPQAIHFHGEHRLTEKVVYHSLMPVVRWISDKQDGKERPTILIDWTTLQDSYGKPKSSLSKAIEFLLNAYRLYFLAPAPTNSHAFLSDAQTWLEEYVSVPAWNRVIFANQTSLLCGDYLITAQKTDDFLGTVIEFGSDEFKTWEEVIVFFERLGGQ